MATLLRARISDDVIMSEWRVPVLGEVITLAEATIMFQRHPGAIKQAIYQGKIEARRSFTGGQWLISLVSIIAHYGTPEKDPLTCLKLK